MTFEETFHILVSSCTHSTRCPVGSVDFNPLPGRTEHCQDRRAPTRTLVMKLWVWAKNDQPNQPQKMDGLVPEITSYVPAIYKSSFIHMYIYIYYILFKFNYFLYSISIYIMSIHTSSTAQGGGGNSKIGNL